MFYSIINYPIFYYPLKSGLHKFTENTQNYVIKVLPFINYTPV